MQSAISAFEKALKIDNASFLAHYRLGTCLLKEGRKREAVKALNSALMLNSEDVGTLVKLGEIYSKMDEKQQEAMLMLEKAIGYDFAIPEAHMSLGRIYER